MRCVRGRFFIFALILPFLPGQALSAGAKQALTGSKHDLGATGSGPVTSGASNSCVFCHAPHNVLPTVTPLWNHQLSSQTYTTYTSSTYNSGSQTPSAGSSKLCLSCHDGTVAVGLTVSNGSMSTSGSMTAINRLGTNLSADHPVSMTPVNDGQLATSLFSAPPSTKDPSVKLATGKVECTSCHDPHTPNNDPVVTMFLARSNSSGNLCLACHDPTRAQPNVLNGWAAGAHGTATNTVSASLGIGEYGTVGANACSSCHGTHKNPVGARNLKAAEQSACSPCHGGTNISPALRNVMGDFSKTYAHPATTVSSAHDATETLPINTTRHAECPDCHNSHAAAAQTGTALPPAIQAGLTGVSGYDTAGAQRPAAREYQVCMKCHADSANKPQSSTYQAYGRTPSRYPQGTMPTGYTVSPARPADQYNARIQFTGTIGHNVMGTSTVTTANTTLRAYMLNIDGTNNTSRPLTSTSQIYCIDCHNNDQARSSKGTGANGPHGSSYAHLLERNLYIEPAGGGSGNTTAGKALCNKCHNVGALTSPHSDHSSYGCTVCHDPHGVIGGSAAANRAMMNFDTAIVSKGTTYFGYFYNGTGSGQKGCYVTCHGRGHNPERY
jgi:predicted CXXCH cytochrome family protein